MQPTEDQAAQTASGGSSMPAGSAALLSSAANLAHQNWTGFRGMSSEEAANLIRSPEFRKMASDVIRMLQVAPRGSADVLNAAVDIVDNRARDPHLILATQALQAGAVLGPPGWGLVLGALVGYVYSQVMKEDSGECAMVTTGDLASHDSEPAGGRGDLATNELVLENKLEASSKPRAKL